MVAKLRKSKGTVFSSRNTDITVYWPGNKYQKFRKRCILGWFSTGYIRNSIFLLWNKSSSLVLLYQRL